MGALKTDSHKNHWATAVSEDVRSVTDTLLFAKLKQTGNPPWSWLSTLLAGMSSRARTCLSAQPLRGPTYLADVHGRHLCGADWRVAGRVGEGLAGTYGQLLLLPRGDNLLGNCRQEDTGGLCEAALQTQGAWQRPRTVPIIHCPLGPQLI